MLSPVVLLLLLSLQLVVDVAVAEDACTKPCSMWKTNSTDLKMCCDILVQDGCMYNVDGKCVKRQGNDDGSGVIAAAEGLGEDQVCCACAKGSTIVDADKILFALNKPGRVGSQACSSCCRDVQSKGTYPYNFGIMRPGECSAGMLPQACHLAEEQRIAASSDVRLIAKPIQAAEEDACSEACSMWKTNTTDLMMCCASHFKSDKCMYSDEGKCVKRPGAAAGTTSSDPTTHVVAPAASAEDKCTTMCEGKLLDWARMLCCVGHQQDGCIYDDSHSKCVTSKDAEYTLVV